MRADRESVCGTNLQRRTAKEPRYLIIRVDCRFCFLGYWLRNGFGLELEFEQLSQIEIQDKVGAALANRIS
jgi:hypothetical protein